MTKVLIVDDDQDICQLLQELLEDEGFQVQSVYNGQQAMEVLQREEGWVVLLDLRMPEVDGREVLRRVQSNPRLRRKNKIVVMSAALRRTRRAQPLLPGIVQRLVAKPFELEEVVEAVEALVS